MLLVGCYVLIVTVLLVAGRSLVEGRRLAQIYNGLGVADCGDPMPVPGVAD